MMTEGRFGEIVAPLRRTLQQRSTRYEYLAPVAGE
jgi:hypothetical protein